MFQERLSTLSIPYIKSDKLRQTNCNEFLDNFVMKKAGQNLFTVYCVMFNFTWFNDCSFLFIYAYFINDSISEIETSPVATVGIGELSPSKFECETLSKDFIKFSECQVRLRKFKPPIQDFLATVLVFKLHHIFSRDSLVAFDSYQSEKVRNTRILK